MRRPEPAGHDAQVGAQPFRERRLELLLVVADDRDQRRLEPEPHELARDERAVAIVPVAPDELAPGDDDDATQEAKMPRAVTTNASGLPPGYVHALAVHDDAQVARACRC